MQLIFCGLTPAIFLSQGSKRLFELKDLLAICHSLLSKSHFVRFFGKHGI
jgi:hypothetical protein